MKSMAERLSVVEQHIKSNQVKIMIIGLGSVGSYLLDYLISANDPALRIVVVGRDAQKMQTKVNITKVAGLIRELNKSSIEVEGEVDLNDVDTIRKAIEKHQPDFIVNSSRAYSGLKYGSLSWKNIRAYGIWSPLAIRFTKNIMEACELAETNAIVINTSYSDAVIPWLKSAGKAYPDFGSGNLNHLAPRMKFAVADILGVDDFWNVDVNFAAGHFHDVCISREGHCEGESFPLKVFYRGEEKDISEDEIVRRCCISMPVDQTRNMMNASSNYRIITAIMSVVRTGASQKLFIPGFDGNLGGYPVCVGYFEGKIDARIDESVFSYEEMFQANKISMSLDGIESITDGKLVYTDALLEKVKKAFGAELPKVVAYENIEETANRIIDEIIIPQLK